MRYWIFKSEPDCFSLDDLANSPNQTTAWDGVRNYQARNFMRDLCKIGDPVLFYHSSCAQPGIVGIGEIASEPYPDPTQFEETSEYFDAKSTQEKPRWVQVDVLVLHKVRLVPIAELRTIPGCEGMRVLQKGNRLSITPVNEDEWKALQPYLIPQT